MQAGSFLKLFWPVGRKQGGTQCRGAIASGGLVFMSELRCRLIEGCSFGTCRREGPNCDVPKYDRNTKQDGECTLLPFVKTSHRLEE
jgi:hypothetical protein